eukprot:6201098-Prymnesium_polylepis.1
MQHERLDRRPAGAAERREHGAPVAGWQPQPAVADGSRRRPRRLQEGRAHARDAGKCDAAATVAPRDVPRLRRVENGLDDVERKQLEQGVLERLAAGCCCG